jgi:hypothetical protein
MATQAEVKNYITKNMSAELVDGDLYKIVYDLGNDRSQLVYAAVRETVMNVSSPFAKTEDVTPKQAIKAVEDFTFGIGTLGDWYVVRHVVPLADLDESEIIVGLEIVAGVADELEEELIGGDAL